MHLRTAIVLCTCVLVQSSCALNVLISNDDSWATANIRALYDAVRAAGHDAVIAAPVMQQSGTNGLRQCPSRLDTDGAFGVVKRGALAQGADANDDHVWYINTTPASSVEYGLRDICPRLFRNGNVDLVLTGTNQGYNLGLAYLGSGTFGAAKYAITSNNIPAIAFSAGNTAERAYTDLHGDNDQANVYARMAVTLLQHLIDNRDTANNLDGGTPRLLPGGTFLNVNFPDQARHACSVQSTRWVLTRILGTLDRSPDTCACPAQACQLPTESSVARAQTLHPCTNTISVAVPHLRPDASAAQQEAVAQKLRDLLVCPS